MKPLPYRWELVGWLWLAFLLNQADRQIFNIVLPLVKSDLRLSDVQAGLVASVFTASLAVMIPVAGYAGDIYCRKRIIVCSLLGWSLSTLLTGFSPGLLYLIVVRSVATGVGEAFYAPSAFSLIAEHHIETRAQAMAVHQTSLYVGVVLSGLLAGYFGDRFGWRSAFWTFGFVGIVVASVMSRRLRGSSPGSSPGAERPPARLVLRTILSRPTALLLALALGGMVFVNIGYLTWMPTYLHERFHLSLANAGFSSMFYHHLFAFFGVMLGGRLSDHFARTRPRFRLELQGAGLLLATPFLYLIGSTSELAPTYFALGAFGFFRGFYDSNIYASLFEVIEPRFHASASGVMTAFAFVVGSFAPVALGAVKQAVGLSLGLSGLSLVYLAAAGSMFTAVSVFFQDDFLKRVGGSECSVSTAK
ncbi:MAG: MFS transporter [Acidobacteriota bacterium]